MTVERTAHRLRYNSHPLAFAIVAIVALVTTACSSPAVVGHDGTGGVGHLGGVSGTGATAGVSGMGGSGGITINITASMTSSGGTTGAATLSDNPCKGADAGCQAKTPEGCGDGINNQGGIEECDDGNALPGDGCNGACKVEPNWTCPPAGLCTRKIICGDGSLGAGEVCDDGNTLDKDGCNSTCTLQDPAYQCTPGQPCVRLSQCGNKRIEAGENCDDGNTLGSDGCSTTCQLETGWVCPKPGSACKRPPRCGDGTVNSALGELCDDGNTVDGDGCSGNCKIKGAGCVCTPGALCKCPAAACGNGTIEGGETCDDGNAKSGDGCSATCAIETGYGCPFTGAPCVPSCGDGIVLAPMEQCDPAMKGTNVAQACSSTCKWNSGWACTGNPPDCHATKCGDGKVEGSEGCDDGNTAPGDGCSPSCRFEPSCSAATGTCTSKCGDGIVMPAQPDGPVMPGGACDDGNTAAGDGCSATCTVEPGYRCEQPKYTAPTMTVPITYRDFPFGGDFQPGALGKNAAVQGLVAQTLDNEGKPASSGLVGGQGYITSVASFANWYRDVPGTNSSYKSTLTLHDNGRGGYVNWLLNETQWTGYTNVRWCPDGATTCVDCNPYEATVAPNTIRGCRPGATCKCFVGGCTPWGIGNNNTCIGDTVVYEGNPVFYPVDNLPGMMTPLAQYSPATVPSSYGGGWQLEPGKPLHNFSFTSEVRYWFGYVSGKQYTLDFTGDDDVWVFVNRTLAVDLGGIHTPVNGRIVLNATGGGTVTVTQTEGGVTVGGVTTLPTTTNMVDLGMQSGGVYEIAVFQAERQTSASTYKLTLSGFNDSASECKAICGDGVVSPGEQCDNGIAKNLGGYNQCTSTCLLGPHCGDGKVDAVSEVCDNGINNSEYGTTQGCGPGCKLPASCGDGVVQVNYGEECDDGPKNIPGTSPTAAYGGKCMSTCQLGGYCGDGQVNGPELCDDGANDGTYGTCNPECTPAPKCGDAVVQADYGEECEPTQSNDPNCTSACRKPGGCGDGKIQSPEQCDDGAALNLGQYGGCAPSCVYAPHCGDGIKNGPEECDDGILNGAYGGCTAQCKLGPYCGDGILGGPEECDDGPQNGADGLCSTACKTISYIPL